MQKNAHKIRVIYADTDAMGIVYHTNYIKWFEIGRNELMRDNDIKYTDVEKAGFGLPVTKAFSHFLLPARYDDIILIETKIDYFRRVSVKFDYEIWDEPRENVLVEGYTVHAFVKDGKIARPPEEFALKFTAAANQNH